MNDVVAASGYGWYQYKCLFVLGIINFADAAEIWLATIILGEFLLTLANVVFKN